MYWHVRSQIVWFSFNLTFFALISNIIYCAPPPTLFFDSTKTNNANIYKCLNVCDMRSHKSSKRFRFFLLKLQICIDFWFLTFELKRTTTESIFSFEIREHRFCLSHTCIVWCCFLASKINYLHSRFVSKWKIDLKR